MKRGSIYNIFVAQNETDFSDLLDFILKRPELEQEAQEKNLLDYMATAALFTTKTKVPAIYKGIRKQDDKIEIVFERLQIEGEKLVKKDRIFSLDEFANQRKQYRIVGPIGANIKKLFDILQASIT